jgi:hypothetical protein
MTDRIRKALNREFEVVGSEEGHGRGPGGPKPEEDDETS